MKKSIYNPRLQPFYLKYILFTMVFVSFTTLYAQESASKRINKSYQVGENELLKIQNKYGKVHINTNTGSTISLDIEIKANAKNKEKAQALVDRVTIRASQSNGVIFYETILGETSEKNWWSGWTENYNKNDFEINYTITMPSKNPLDVTNSFGNAYLADFSGKLDMNIRYGNLKANNITGATSKNIQISYGNGNIEYLESGSLVIKYSNLDMERGGNIKLENAYSNSEINMVEQLNIEHKYGDLKIGKVTALEGTSAYSSLKIDALKSSLKITSKYNGSFKVSGISTNFKSIEIDAKYNNCNLKFDENTGCNFDISTKYGSFDLNKELATFVNKETTDYGGKYTGKYNRGGGKVIVSVQYGNVSFR